MRYRVRREERAQIRHQLPSAIVPIDADYAGREIGVPMRAAAAGNQGVEVVAR